MISLFQKRYVIMLQLDSGKDAELVGAKEGYAYVEGYTDSMCRDNKIQITIPTSRSYFGAVRRAAEYSKMGIFYIVVKQ